MRITPLDVRKQEFRKGMRGLDPEEVYAFLATVADEYELVLNDNKALRERLLELDDKVQEYRSMEKTLRDTLLTAERVNVEAKDNARREASIIIKEAQIEAEKALRDIKTQAMKLRAQVQQLRGQRDSFLARMKVVAESHLSYIKSAVDDFQREDSDVDVDVDVDVATERLADHPVDSVDRVAVHPTPHVTAERTPSPAPRVTPEPRPAREPAVEAAPDPTAPRADAPVPTHTPLRAEPATPTRSRDEGPRGDGPDPITMIIDRMKRGQQEILSSGAGAPELPGGTEKTQGTIFGGRKAEEAGTPAPATDDDTRELQLEDIRREIGVEEKAER